MPQAFTKDPDAVLDYRFDWSDWLETGDAIATHTVSADTGITVDSSSITDSSTSVTVWLSGGTVGATYDVACLIVTSAGRTDERTVSVRVLER